MMGGAIQSRPFPTQTEIAWAAGLFEGEGCLNGFVRQSGKIQIQARLAMTDKDVVERFAAIVGCGWLHQRHGPAHQARKYKPLTEWYVYEAEKVRGVIALLMPYLGERRRAKAEWVLEFGADIRPYGETRTHCLKGHLLEGSNLVLEPRWRDGKQFWNRRCRECRTIQTRKRIRKKRGISPDRYRVKEVSQMAADVGSYHNPMPTGQDGGQPPAAVPQVTVIPVSDIPNGQGTAAPGKTGSAPPPPMDPDLGT